MSLPGLHRLVPLGFLLGANLLFSGCSTNPIGAGRVTVRVTDKATGRPVEGILIERYRPPNFFDGFVNYNKVDVRVESRWTDSQGACTIRRLTRPARPGERRPWRSTPEGTYILYDSTARPLRAEIGGQVFILTPSWAAISENMMEILKADSRRTNYNHWAYKLQDIGDVWTIEVGKPARNWAWQQR